MIDLSKVRAAVIKFIEDSLAEFTSQHPEVKISTFGLFCEGYCGNLAAWIDTATHSNEKLAQHNHWLVEQKCDQKIHELMGEDLFQHWIGICEGRGQDSVGQFNDSCNDFAFSVGSIELPGWPDTYNESAEEEGHWDFRWDFRWPDGRITKANECEGEAGIDRQIFPLLVECLSSVDLSKYLAKAAFRVGVEMKDKTFVRFWIPKEIQPKGYEPYEYCYEELGF